ncbi:MAG: NeuD/PglB/VioB family sugar acetyltransferase [Nitrospira sp.]|nr:NeuD/PglB/VioB family sugar acetyltransferase [Nitrospira sp.]
MREPAVNRLVAGNPVIVLGTTQFSEEIADLVSETTHLELAGFVENLDPDRCQQQLLGKPVYWVDEISRLAGKCQFLCGIGTTRRRGYVDQAMRLGAGFATLEHPTSHRSATSRIGMGSILGVNTIVAAHTHIAEHVILNRAATVGHHTRIGSYVTIGPGTNIAGRCSVGDGTYIGMGANVVDGITIGNNSVVGVGAVVTKDVPDNVCVVGAPARIVKTAIEGR